jgi:hypothetical protein
VYDPPGQTKYLNRFQNEAVTTYVGAGGSIRAAREVKGVAAYLIDHVEAGGLAAGLAAFTAAQAVAAAAGLVVRINAGSAMALADVDTALSVVVADTELTNGGGSASTGNLEELLRIFAGAEYVVPSGSIFDTNGATFNPVESGTFTAGVEREIFNTGYFMLSVNTGALAELKAATYTYKDVHAAAVTIYDYLGAVV